MFFFDAILQLSTMTGVKDPTEQPKMVEINQEIKQNNVIVKRSFADFADFTMQNVLKFSTEMAESFRLMLDNLKVRIEQFQEENQSIFDLFSLSTLYKWTEREK